MITEIKVKAVPLKEYLGNPTGYLWAKAKQELGIRTVERVFTITQTKALIGWFVLYRESAPIRNRDMALIAYYREARSQVPRFLVPMTGKEILALKSRPSNATLYRRGFRVSKRYDPSDIEKLLRRG